MINPGAKVPLLPLAPSRNRGLCQRLMTAQSVSYNDVPDAHGPREHEKAVCLQRIFCVLDVV